MSTVRRRESSRSAGAHARLSSFSAMSSTVLAPAFVLTVRMAWAIEGFTISQIARRFRRKKGRIRPFHGRPIVDRLEILQELRSPCRTRKRLEDSLCARLGIFEGAVVLPLVLLVPVGRWYGALRRGPARGDAVRVLPARKATSVAQFSRWSKSSGLDRLSTGSRSASRPPRGRALLPPAARIASIVRPAAGPHEPGRPHPAVLRRSATGTPAGGSSPSPAHRRVRGGICRAV
jgi:hypothetical protein